MNWTRAGYMRRDRLGEYLHTSSRDATSGSDRAGVPEFVGPNRVLSEPGDYAVIAMGRMVFAEVHDDWAKI